MILQQLHADADAILRQTGQGEMTPSMYIEKPMMWIIELSSDRRVGVSFTKTPGTNNRGTSRWMPHMTIAQQFVCKIPPLVSRSVYVCCLGTAR